MQETWKDISDYEGLYQISNLGRVKSLSRIIVKKNGVHQPFKEKILSFEVSNKGYIVVTLCKNTKIKRFLVHRLVAKAFIPNPNNLSQVDHKDGNKENNHTDNLEWCTQSINMRHAYEQGLWHGNMKVRED